MYKNNQVTIKGPAMSRCDNYTKEKVNPVDVKTRHNWGNTSFS